MSFASSQPQLPIKVHEPPKLPDCKFERLQNDRGIFSVEIQRLPVIKERLKKGCQKGVAPDKSPKHVIKQDINLPKLSASQQRMDAGEPNGSPAQQFSVQQLSVDSSEKCLSFNRSLWLESSSSDTSKKIGVVQFERPDGLGNSFSRSRTHETKEVTEELEESNALKRWKYWMEDKKAMQDYLSKQIGRDPQDLLLQESDKYREVMENKLMHWYSRVPGVGKRNVSPVRWKPTLRIRGNFLGLYNRYCAVKSKVEKEERPEVEFIGLPNTIKKEKGIMVTGKQKKKSNRVHCLEVKESSHKVEVAELEIIGKKIVPGRGKDENLKSFKIYPEIIEPENDGQLVGSQGTNSTVSQCQDKRPSIFCLVIDGEEIKYEVGIDCSQKPERTFDWRVNFGVSKIESIAEKSLRIENRGTISVRYDWIFPETEQKLSLNPLQRSQHEPWFFFNKNSGFFLPGQIYDLKFYFRAKSSGMGKEMWYLKTTPSLSSNLKFGRVTLSGVATEGVSTLPHCLRKYVHHRTLSSDISAVIDIILYKVFNSFENLEHIEYRSIFSEKQMFEHHNPQYFYHSAIVGQLKEFLNEIPESGQTEWDYSLSSLIDLVKTYKTGKERSNALSDISQKARALLRPSYVWEGHVKKYRMTYAVLCKMTNFMEEDYFYLRNLVSEKVEEYLYWSEAGEARNASMTSNLTAEEMGESDYKKETFEIKPINFMFFQTLFYLKVYHRLCEAIEHMVGILETRKFLEPWKQVNHKPTKPPRRANLSADLVSRSMSTCQMKPVRRGRSSEKY